MKRLASNTSAAALAALGLASSPMAAHAANDLYAIETSTNRVFVVDSATAVVAQVGVVSGTNGSLGSLELSPDGTYYGLTIGSVPNLYSIDSSTWQASLIGPATVNFCFEGGLAIAPSGEAWAVNCGSSSAAELFSIDLSGGPNTLIGVLSGGSHDINGLEWRSDGKLVGVDRTTNSVVEIDPTNANLTVLSSVAGSVGAGGGMTVQNGTSYFCTSGPSASIAGSNELYQFDPFSGVSVSLGTFSGGLSGDGFNALARFFGGVGTSYCFGDDSGTSCPCANLGAADEGCANSSGGGANLTASGSASAVTDDLVLAARGLLPAQPALLFVGANAINGGLGNMFGDGLRCAGGGVLRLGVGVPDASGDASWGPGLAAAGGWSAGDTRRFQVWYRDPQGSPCGSGFNLSNGVEIDFQ